MTSTGTYWMSAGVMSTSSDGKLKLVLIGSYQQGGNFTSISQMARLARVTSRIRAESAVDSSSSGICLPHGASLASFKSPPFMVGDSSTLTPAMSDTGNSS